MTSRQLIVMRHAKAGPYTDADHERELTPRGVRDATAAGSYLATVAMPPDYALVSTATRAVQTWEAVAKASGSQAEMNLSDALYNASPQDVIEALQAAPDSAKRVIYVGHNPTAEQVANLLADGEGAVEAIDRMQKGFPTAALTVFDVEVPWTDLAPDSCRVLDFHVGRG